MRFRVSRRIGPVRFSAYEYSNENHYGSSVILDAYRPNWPKRIAIIAGALTPAWIAFALGWGILFVVLAIIGGVGLLITYGRSEAAYETNFRSFVAWCAAVTTGTALAMMVGMLAQSLT